MIISPVIEMHAAVIRRKCTGASIMAADGLSPGFTIQIQCASAQLKEYGK
jgi:hypothetical protein